MNDNTKNKKSALIVASVASMIAQFNISNIKILNRLGYHVDVAANFVSGSTCTDKEIQELLKILDHLSVDCYQIDFDRKVTDIKADVRAFMQLDLVAAGKAEPVNKVRHHFITRENSYTFIHSHSPIGGVTGRIIAKKHHMKAIYTAHGFHFYDGAPKKNWLVFYPVEKGLSWITDVLVTINREDYKRAKRKFHAKKVVYIPGIGVDIRKFEETVTDRTKKRAELGIGDTDILLLSVGELNENKNHKAVIEALGKIDSSVSCHLHYCIAGQGEQHNKLRNQADQAGVQLHLLGYRNDIAELLKAADVFILSSVREGLNAGLMEAMASGLPCIVSDIRGNRELIRNAVGGYTVMPENSDEWKAELQHLLSMPQDMKAYGAYNKKHIQKYSRDVVNRLLQKLYTQEWKAG